MTTPALTIVWEDIATGRTKPLGDTAVVPAGVGSKPTLRVQADRALCPAMRLELLDVDGDVVKSVLDSNYPWRLNGDKPAALTVGVWRLRATPCDLKGNAVAGPVVGKVIVAGPDGNAPADTSGGNQPSEVFWPRGFGTGCDIRTGIAPWIRTVVARGVTDVRGFGGGATPDGDYSGWHDAGVREILKADPHVRVHLQLGVSERDDSKGRLAIPMTDAGLIRYWTAHVRWLNSLGPDAARVITRDNNEINLAQYLHMLQAANKLSLGVVKYCMKSMRTFRAIAGPLHQLGCCTVGYDAAAPVHVDYNRAFVGEGVLEVVDFMDDHCYCQQGLQQLEDQLGGIRELIGPTFPLDLTEINLKYVPVAQYAGTARKWAAVVRKHNARPFIYRGRPGTDKVRWADPVSVTDANGQINELVATDWSMPAKAAA